MYKRQDIRQFGVEGRGWEDTENYYDRLPARAASLVRKPVWDLSHDSAGLCVRFVTDATEIHARWALTNPWLYQPNGTAIAVSGLDLYVRIPVAGGKADSSPCLLYTSPACPDRH